MRYILTLLALVGGLALIAQGVYLAEQDARADIATAEAVDTVDVPRDERIAAVASGSVQTSVLAANPSRVIAHTEALTGDPVETRFPRLPGPRTCFWRRGPHGPAPLIAYGAAEPGTVFWLADVVISRDQVLRFDADIPPDMVGSLTAYTPEGEIIETFNVTDWGDPGAVSGAAVIVISAGPTSLPDQTRFAGFTPETPLELPSAVRGEPITLAWRVSGQGLVDLRPSALPGPPELTLFQPRPGEDGANILSITGEADACDTLNRVPDLVVEATNRPPLYPDPDTVQSQWPGADAERRGTELVAITGQITPETTQFHRVCVDTNRHERMCFVSDQLMTMFDGSFFILVGLKDDVRPRNSTAACGIHWLDLDDDFMRPLQVSITADNIGDAPQSPLAPATLRELTVAEAESLLGCPLQE